MFIFDDLHIQKKHKQEEEHLTTDFVKLSSHQLRTPLSAVKWFSEILLTERFGKLNQKQLDYVTEIHRSNERAISLINDLLQVSKVEEGKLHMNFSETDLVIITEEVIRAHQDMLAAHDIGCNLEVIGGPLPLLHADKILIRRVIQNLLSNAIKYTPKAGSVKVVIKRNKDDIIFSIKDSGIGIPKSQQKKVFEKFFRASNAAQIRTDGTGLGLYITKSMVAAHGGKIWFESREGEGSVFTFCLPLANKS